MARHVRVEDPDNLSQAFLERLRFTLYSVVLSLSSDISCRARVEPAQSRPIDLNYLSARLEDVSANRQASPQPSSCATTEPYDEEECHRQELEKEVEYYNTLIKEGGRPSHPINLGPGVAQDPGEYREILSVWHHLSHPHGSWMVFEAQMYEWGAFRHYQRHHREGDRFPKYVELVKRSLAKHNFTRPFAPIEDLEHQDKLTTWIEFLDYEYWLYDKDMMFVKRRQPQYDEAWKELVDSHVLRQFETEAFICSIDSAFYHDAEEQQAQRVLEFARSNVTSVHKSITDLTPSSHLEKKQQQHQQQVREAQSKLDAAVKSLALIEWRSSLVNQFMNKLSRITLSGGAERSYLVVKEDAENRSLLCKWILQQIPLIELESKPAGTDGRDSTKSHIRLPASSKRARAESDGERCCKRRRQGTKDIRLDCEPPKLSVNRSRYDLESRQHDAGDEVSPLARPDTITLDSDPRSTRESIIASQFSGTGARKAKARSAQYSTSRKTTQKNETRASKFLLRETRVRKARRKNRTLNARPVSGSPLRRSTRPRRPPDRVQ
ncbi:MAG: hypothetical protein LQ341_003532 [Variospora aurantia]|nr:MAG: hypothetical protein LQ341_003532 [Variospora aurantia]